METFGSFFVFVCVCPCSASLFHLWADVITVRVYVCAGVMAVWNMIAVLSPPASLFQTGPEMTGNNCEASLRATAAAAAAVGVLKGF